MLCELLSPDLPPGILAQPVVAVRPRENPHRLVRLFMREKTAGSALGVRMGAGGDEKIMMCVLWRSQCPAQRRTWEAVITSRPLTSNMPNMAVRSSSVKWWGSSPVARSAVCMDRATKSGLALMRIKDTLCRVCG